MGAMLGVLHVRADEVLPAARWSFEELRGGKVTDGAGAHPGKAEGELQQAPGAEGQSLVFDGESTLVTVPATPELSIGEGPFTVAAWVNPYERDRGQQMLVAKNDYAAGQREWSLMLDKDNLFRFYASHGGWKTLCGKTVPIPGQWTHVAVTVEKGQARLYVNGKREGEAPLAAAVAATAAPLTLGGVRSGGSLTQRLRGALDEVAIYGAALPADVITRLADKKPAPHPVPAPETHVNLWSGGTLPKAAEAPVLKDAEFHVIKPYEFARDGYRFLHGVALAFHKDRLYASFGHNTGGENTDTEEARVRVSDDGGKTWGATTTIDSGNEPGVGVSHGVFLSHGGRLWAFHGAYTGTMGKSIRAPMC